MKIILSICCLLVIEIGQSQAVANKECKKLIMRNAAFLAKGCLPAVTVAIKNAEIKEDVFDTLQGIFNRAIDVTSGPQCMSQFVQYHQQLKQAGCNELAQIHEDNMNQIRMGQIFKKMTESFGTPENALATFREMNSATCEPNLTAFAQYTTQNLRAVCPLTSNAIEDYIKVSKTVGRGN
ncbi:unnamed protein product [Cyprideis torosa]|uniref:Uncharacterized protein n=1 Tax=Cyprideis torosa TaxID=163714 RepID=A0A7R8WN84_9CRUS|nr:unnamed protein product [Cyprideis torosa]CAG0900315.1 unnamed protein product [Cyprideis torosa]